MHHRTCQRISRTHSFSLTVVGTCRCSTLTGLDWTGLDWTGLDWSWSWTGAGHHWTFRATLVCARLPLTRLPATDAIDKDVHHSLHPYKRLGHPAKALPPSLHLSRFEHAHSLRCSASDCLLIPFSRRHQAFLLTYITHTHTHISLSLNTTHVLHLGCWEEGSQSLLGKRKSTRRRTSFIPNDTHSLHQHTSPADGSSSV